MKSATLACSNGGQPQPRSRLLRAKASVRPAGTTVGHAQRREQRFAEGAGVQHPPLNIEAFQRRQWPPVIAKLAVVVILEDPGPALLRQSSSAIRRAG